jgi:hypothetical protein
VDPVDTDPDSDTNPDSDTDPQHCFSHSINLKNIRHEAGAIKQWYVGNVSTVSTVN